MCLFTIDAQVGLTMIFGLVFHWVLAVEILPVASCQLPVAGCQLSVEWGGPKQKIPQGSYP